MTGAKEISRSAGVRLNPAMLGIAVLVLMVIGGFSLRGWRKYSRANADVVHSRQIIESVDSLLSSLLDAETGQRGFLLTGETRYLEPYHQSIQVIPAELAKLSNALVSRQAESGDMTRLNDLVNQKLTELRKTIELRRTKGTEAAMTVVLSDQGKQRMDEIRNLCSQIRQGEKSVQSQASLEGEVATETVLLVTVAGALVLLFFFVIGLEPFMRRGTRFRERSWLLRYGVAVLAVAVATLLRTALTPLLGDTLSVIPFITFFPAVLLATWYGGLRVGTFSVLLSTGAAVYFFLIPGNSLRVSNPGGLVALLIFIVLCFGIVTVSDSQRRAVDRAERAEESEREERQRFETTLASIGDAVISTDAKGRIIFVNKVAQSLIRAPERDLVGRHLDDVFQIVNEFTRQKVESPVTKVLREGAIVGLANHTVLIAQDGTEIPIDDSGSPIRTNNGPIWGTVLVFRDITARRQAEQTSQLLASIVASSDDAIIGKNLEGVVTSWNQGAEHLFGYLGEEMIGQSISVISPADRPDEMPGILQRIRQGERLDHFETLRRTKSGKVIHASVTVSPVHDASGRIVGASKIVRDMTAEVRAREEIAEQRERLRVTLNSIGDALMTTDVEGRVTYLNPVAEQLTGWTTTEAAARSMNEVFRIINEDSRLPAENPVTRVLKEGQVTGLANHTTLIARDGKELSIDDSAAPIRNTRGGIIGVVLVFRDITERRHMEKERLEMLAKERTLATERALRETEAELARVSRALTVGELASSIAHEVNQPLAGVITNAEAGLRWLSAQPPNLHETKESLQLIVRDGNRAGAVIRRIREFLRKGKPETAPFDVNETFREAIALAEAALTRSRIELRVQLAHELPRVRGDRIQLQQVILNLIMNSAKRWPR